MGESDDESYSKVTSIQVGSGAHPNALLTLQHYLLGYEFPSTVIVFHRQPRKISFVASKTKSTCHRTGCGRPLTIEVQHIEALPTNSGIKIDAQTRGKDDTTARQLPLSGIGLS